VKFTIFPHQTCCQGQGTEFNCWEMGIWHWWSPGQLPSDLCIILQQSLFFELWILLGGNSCCVSKTQSLFLWRGQTFTAGGHFFSPVHTV